MIYMTVIIYRIPPMDNLTLSLAVLIFFLGLFLYFATLGFNVPPPARPPEAKKEPQDRRIPAILRCNVAVSRLVHMERP